MNKAEEKRFDRLQKDRDEEAGGWALEKITYPDLLLLLREDRRLRKLLRKVVGAGEGDSSHEETAPETAEEEPIAVHEAVAPSRPVAAVPAPIPVIDRLRGALAPELSLLAQVKADAELAADWLGGVEEDEGRQLVRLIARAAQWETVLALWDRLALRCKERLGPATMAELDIMGACLATHNLIWRGRQASITHAGVGAAYDFKQHERGTPTGETIRAEWLPGLVNAGGQRQKKPLVAT